MALPLGCQLNVVSLWKDALGSVCIKLLINTIHFPEVIFMLLKISVKVTFIIFMLITVTLQYCKDFRIKRLRIQLPQEHSRYSFYKLISQLILTDYQI